MVGERAGTAACDHLGFGFDQGVDIGGQYYVRPVFDTPCYLIWRARETRKTSEMDQFGKQEHDHLYTMGRLYKGYHVLTCHKTCHMTRR